MALSIDIISDVVCPWCYIGKRRIEAALQLYRERFPDREQPVVRWWPFQLNPDMPAEGMDRKAYLERKFGSSQVGQVYSRVAGVGKEVGIPFAFDRIARQVNTLAAHSLVALAGELGVQDAFQEALFSAYFLNGENLAEDETLVRIASAAGLPEAAVRERLADETARQEIRSQDEHARRLGVSGVPFFVFNNAVGVSGAQEAQALLDGMIQAEEQAAAAATP